MPAEPRADIALRECSRRQQKKTSGAGTAIQSASESIPIEPKACSEPATRRHANSASHVKKLCWPAPLAYLPATPHGSSGSRIDRHSHIGSIRRQHGD